MREPLLVLDRVGRIVSVNPSARRAFGQSVEGQGRVFTDECQLRDLLIRSSGTGEAVFAALTLRGADQQVRRHRVSAINLHRSAEPSFAIQVRDVEDDQFTALTERVRQLHSEIETRRGVQAQLEEAVAENQLLNQELQHRVKNHLQMMIALVSAARREAADPAQKAFAQSLQAKLSVLFEAQRLMYSAQMRGGVPLDKLLLCIAQTMRCLTATEVTVDVDADPATVPNDIAFPIALIANELLTNAVKYNDKASPRVQVSLRNDAEKFVLVVCDNGPGFAATTPKRNSSGLGLVRGVCRQVGGQLELESGEGGTNATVRFSLPNTRNGGD